MDPQSINTLFDYNNTTYNRVWDCVLELTPEQFVEESDYSWLSVRNHLVHLMSTDNRWLARVRGDELPDRLEPIDYPDQDAVRQKWDEVRDRVFAYITGLTTEDLHEIIEVDLPHRGGTYPNRRWEILLHMVNHGTDHRAQILARLHELGAMTVEQDLILYLWDHQRN